MALARYLFNCQIQPIYAKKLQATLCFSLKHCNYLELPAWPWFYDYLMPRSLFFFKTVRVAVFAEGPAAEEARAAGADVVGGDELIEEIRKGTSFPLLFCDFRNLFFLEISPIATCTHPSSAS
jgi:hypothetical protein